MSSLILDNEEVSAAFNLDVAEPGELDASKLVPQLIEDVYRNDFFKSKHLNFIGETDGGHVIISFQRRVINGAHRGLKTTKKGTEEFTIPESVFKLISWDDLANYFSKDAQNVYQVYDSDIRQDILSIEEKHPQETDHLKIAIIYCKPGQKTPQEFFSNTEGSPAFHKFLEGMGSEIQLLNWPGYSGDMSVKKEGTTYYTKWHDLEVIYHVSVMMQAEGHRRLIGNDVCVIFFRDEGGEPFDVTAVTNLGTMPQCFTLVQPAGDNGYQIASFSRKTIKPHPPSIPSNHIFSMEQTKDFLLSKLHNGFIQATIFCPPINRLWYTPRGALIDEICSRYPKENPKENPKATKARLKKEKERREQMREEAQNDEKKDLVVFVIAGQNLAVRDSLVKSSDPYVVLSVWDQQVKSKVLKMTLNPVWNEELRLDLRGVDLTDACLTITVMDWNRLSTHEFMGEIEIPFDEIITEWLPKEDEPIWFKLRSRATETVSGEISVKLMLDGSLDPEKDPLPDDPHFAALLTSKAPRRSAAGLSASDSGGKIRGAPKNKNKSSLAIPALRHSVSTRSTPVSPASSPQMAANRLHNDLHMQPHMHIYSSQSTSSVPSSPGRGLKEPSALELSSPRKLSTPKKKIDIDGASSAIKRTPKLERSSSDGFEKVKRKRSGSLVKPNLKIEDARSSSIEDTKTVKIFPGNMSPRSDGGEKPSSPRSNSDSQISPRQDEEPANAVGPSVRERVQDNRSVRRTVSGGLPVTKPPVSPRGLSLNIANAGASDAHSGPLSARGSSHSSGPRSEEMKNICVSVTNDVETALSSCNNLTQIVSAASEATADEETIHKSSLQVTQLASAMIRSMMNLTQSVEKIEVEQSLPFLVLKKRTVAQYASKLEEVTIGFTRACKAAMLHMHNNPSLDPVRQAYNDVVGAAGRLKNALNDLRDHV